jgi:glycosyltransferase involved in cell wall biosynthesis
VLYVETPVHLLGLDVLPGDPFRFFRFLSGPRRVSETLSVATLPILLPMFQMSHVINRTNHLLIRRMLRVWMKELGLRNPLFWIYTPFSASVLNGSGVDAVYECVDEFRAARGLVNPRVVGEMEDDLLRKVRMTIVTQENLLSHRAALCSNTFCVPNGADLAPFRDAALGKTRVPDDLARLPQPRLGFVGHIHYWIDLKLIRFLAEQRPNWSVVLVGPASPMAQMSEVKGLPNIHLLGRKPQNEIAAYIQGFDCCLNPYMTGALADHCSPLKLYEYLASGKPVVSTEMPEARKFPGLVDVASTYGEFLRQCEARIEEPPLDSVQLEARLAVAAPHSWSARFAEINRLLDRVLEPSVD